MQVQDIINASSTDFRQVLANTSPDSALFVSWVDRIQKDSLHTGVYNPLTQAMGTISVVSGTSSYTIPSNLVSGSDMWALGTGWTGTFAAGFVQAGGNLAPISDNSFTSVVGTAYQLSFTISNSSGGTITPHIGGVTGPAFTGNGTYTFSTGPVPLGSTNLSLTANSSFTGTITQIFLVVNGGVRRIQLVYDRTFDRMILPIDGIVYPTNSGDAGSPRQELQIPVEMLNAETMSQYPKYYKREGPTNLQLFPAPQKTAFNGTYEIHYEFQSPDLLATTSTLLIPNDGIDQVVAGVNAYVAQFLHLDTESQYWAQQYEMLKKGSAIQ